VGDGGEDGAITQVCPLVVFVVFWQDAPKGVRVLEHLQDAGGKDLGLSGAFDNAGAFPGLEVGGRVGGEPVLADGFAQDAAEQPPVSLAGVVGHAGGVGCAAAIGVAGGWAFEKEADVVGGK